MKALRPALRAIPAYTLRGETARVRLNRNESPFDLPVEWKRSVMERAMERPWSRYPEFEPVELVRALARRWDWPEDGVVVGNGSNELLQALSVATLEPGRRALTVEPTFVLYAQQAALAGARVERVSFGEGWSFDVDTLERRLREDAPAAAFLCSPNNPTGSWLEPQSLVRLLEASPETLVVVDEAYGEFAGWSAAALRPRRGNLALLKTFSKAASLAGLRVGYLLAAPEVAAAVRGVKLPYSVGLIAALAAERALEGRGVLEEQVGGIVEERERLERAMSRVPGVRVYPSRANFLLFDVDDAQRVFRCLVEQDVLVRDVSRQHPGLGRSLRVTVGLQQENDLFLKALGRSMENRT